MGEAIMAPFKHHLLSFTIIIISFVACYSTLQDQDPLISSIYVDDSPNYIDDGGSGTFKNLIKQSTNVLSLNRFEELGGISSSLEIVNVNDYGAKGNGLTDDTEVHTQQVQDIMFFYIFLTE